MLRCGIDIGQCRRGPTIWSITGRLRRLVVGDGRRAPDDGVFAKSDVDPFNVGISGFYQPVSA